MNPGSFSQVAQRLLCAPAVPYHEEGTREEAERICAEHGLECRRDEFGNVLVRLRTAKNRRPLVLAAHLDHPGFELLAGGRPGRWLARFLGGVPEAYFRSGVPVRLMPGGIPARVARRTNRKQKLYELVAAPSPRRLRPGAFGQSPSSRSLPPRFGVWELEDFALRRGRIYARACDDLIGVAAILATLIELKRSRARVHVLGVLSRAEEVGFQGALALASRPKTAKGSTRLPADALVLSLETSKELPGVKMGQGVILRVGDRASVFDSAATRFLAETATGLKLRRRIFNWQRALMGGGTCEATAYQEFGFQSAAVCVALGNYHNCGPRNRIAAEFVSLKDACDMVDLLVSAAREMPNYPEFVARLPRRLHRLLQEARRRLRAHSL